MLSGPLKKALIEQALSAELNHHAAMQEPPGETANHRNASSSKAVLSVDGSVRIVVRRERTGICRATIFGVNYKIIAVYTRDMTVREIAMFAQTLRHEISEGHQLGHERGNGGQRPWQSRPFWHDVADGVFRRTNSRVVRPGILRPLGELLDRDTRERLSAMSAELDASCVPTIVWSVSPDSPSKAFSSRAMRVLSDKPGIADILFLSSACLASMVGL